MATGYFKLYRPLQDHWVYSDSRYLHLWIDCLINARWSTEPKKDIYKGVIYTIERGQFLFSRNTYSDRLNIEESTVRRCIDLMLKDEMIIKVMSLGRNKPTIYQIANFDKYNPLNEPSEDVENKGFQVFINPVEAQSQPSGSQVATAKEESNKAIKKKENIYLAEIIEYLNLKTGKTFRLSSDKTKSCLNARWNEGFTELQDYKTVIDKKTKDWLNNKDMEKFLRPETLFGTKFESYVNENIKNVINQQELVWAD